MRRAQVTLKPRIEGGYALNRRHPDDPVSSPRDVTMLPDDADAGLPRPYGGGFEVDEGIGDIIRSRLKKRERARRRWGRFADIWLLNYARILLPSLLILSTVSVMAFPTKIASDLVAGCAALASFSFLLPSVLSSHYMLWVGQDRLGKRNLKQTANDTGAERILNALKEARLHEIMRISNQLGFALVLWIASQFPPGEEFRGLLLVSCILAASISLAHTLIIEQRTYGYSRRLPFLPFHAPSQHESNLQNTLTEVLSAHLDPESHTRFTNWCNDLAMSLKPSIDTAEAIERTLHLLHLEGQHMINRVQLVEEMKSYIDNKKLDNLLFTSKHLDLPELSRLVGHTRAFALGLFHLLDRLQFDLMDHSQSLASHSWRMDSSIPNRCGESRGDLFVMVSNLSDNETPVELEVHIPDGQPSRQVFRLTPTPQNPPNEPLQLWEPEDPDVVHWQLKLVDAAHVLWLGVAWADGIQGRRPVSLNLRHIDGRTISSDTLWTTVHPRSGRGESMRWKMDHARNLAQRWRNQALTRME